MIRIFSLSVSLFIFIFAFSLLLVVDCLAENAHRIVSRSEIGADDFRISDMGGDGIKPDVAYNRTDNLYLVVWWGDDVRFQREIYGQLINGTTGEELGTNDFRISDMGPDGDETYSAEHPAVAWDSRQNRFLVVWRGIDDSSGEWEVYGQFLNGTTGEEIGSNDFRISDMGPDSDTNYDVLDCDLAYNTIDNEFLVVWTGDDNRWSLVEAEYEVFGQRIDADAMTEIGANDFRLSDMGPDGSPTYDASSPAVAFNSTNDEYLVVWSGDDNADPAIDGEDEIFAQRLNGATGEEIGENDFRISDMGPDGDRDASAFSPDIAYNPNFNEYLVVWHGDNIGSGQGDEEYEIYAQFINGASATEIGTNDFRLSSMGDDGDYLYSAYSPKLAFDRWTNRFFVVWQGDDNWNDDDFEIFGQAVSASTGEEVGDDDVYLSNMGPPASDSFAADFPAVAFNSAQTQFLVVWSADNTTDNAFDIWGQRYAIDERDTDSDGTLDINDTDDDADGLSDIDEGSYDTNPLNTDTDNDLIGDNQEVSDGSNPVDRGSVMPILNAQLCSEWNGFLGGMWNVMEHVNMAGIPMDVRSRLYGISGAPQGIRSFSVQPGTQLDLLVHDMNGWTLNSYGKVCSEVENLPEGTLDGRMVYYKQAPGSAPPNYSFEFAFAMPFQNGLSGLQYVPFNTFQPSLDPVDAANFVANWIQITNLGSSSQSGALQFIGQDGITLGTQNVTLEAGGRQDFSGHQFGTNLVGIVKWQPDNSDVPFSLRNVRYFYDNPGGQNTFVTAFQLEGMVGSGERLTAPLDTTTGSSILEIANTTEASQIIAVKIYNSTGTLLDSQSVNLPAFGSAHIITDSILDNAKGIATIEGRAVSGVIAVVMQYARTSTAGIDYLYGIQAREALGDVLRGSYNTFLGQGCRLLLVNPAEFAATANVRMVRFDGEVVLPGMDMPIPGHGMVDYNLCANDDADVYGVVTVQPSTANTIVAHVVRTGANNSYRIPTPVRQ